MFQRWRDTRQLVPVVACGIVLWAALAAVAYGIYRLV